ncbi:MAG: hypothetical protein IJ523_12160 [Succinivibrionaceae bacterium]|nr:hypothetical protein [Succinivibrionaceae bacterium]
MITMEPVWKEKFYIGTSKLNGSWVYSPLCAGITNVDPSVNEQTQQYFFMCGNGGADNEVTGIAPQYNVSGRRIYGDVAQDYIAKLKYKLGDERKTSFKVVTDKETIIADCTITDIVDFGGQATDNEPFSCTIRVNGLPTVSDN